MNYSENQLSAQQISQPPAKKLNKCLINIKQLFNFVPNKKAL